MKIRFKMVFFKKTRQLKGLWLTIMIGLMIIFIEIQGVSALELNPFADTKTFTADGKWGTITINSNFMWIDTGKVAEYSLTSTSEGVIELTMNGIATIYKEGTLFDDVNYGGASLKSGNYYLWAAKDNYVEIPDTYKKICNEVEKNGTQYCQNVVATYEKENQPSYSWYCTKEKF